MHAAPEACTRALGAAMEAVMKTPDFKVQYEKAAMQLARLRDETRLEVKLAEMDVQTRWQEFENRFIELERRAKQDITDATRAAAEELLEQVRKFKATMTKKTNRRAG